MLVFPTMLSFCHFFKKTIKEDSQRKRVKSKVNWNQENVNQFYWSPTRDKEPLVKKDAGISVQCISFLPIMASWSEWWWHLVSTLLPPRSICMCTKYKWRVCEFVHPIMRICADVYASCQSQYCYWRCKLSWTRQVLTPTPLWSWNNHFTVSREGFCYKIENIFGLIMYYFNKSKELNIVQKLSFW